MGDLKRKLEIVQDTIDVSNQSPNKVGRLVDKLQSSSSLDDSETNAVDEHHHHESLDVEKLENLSSELQFNNSSVDDLNEDCLLEIFSYLSINDMIQVKRVCKKWCQVSEQWFKQVQTLVYREDLYVNSQESFSKLEFYEKYYKRKIYDKCTIRGFDDCISILHSCGHHIKYYQVEYSILCERPTKDCEKFMFQWVPKLCKNIVDVQIHGTPDFYPTSEINQHSSDNYTPSSFEVMATHWKKLEKIDITYFPPSVDQNFLELLRNNKQLKTITLMNTLYCKNFEDKFFTYLPTTIEKIIIELVPICRMNERNHFILASKNYTSLQSLTLSGIELTDAMVAAIADIKSLIHLSLGDAPSFSSYRKIDKIANLKGLKSLNLLYWANLHEDSFIYVVESCIKLEHLGIHNDKWLTDKGMATIAKLKKLKCLTIYARHVARSIINSCESLEYLRFTYLEINDNDAIKLLKKATNLKFVDLDYSRGVTKDFFQAASEIANERKNNFLCVKWCSNIFYIHEDIDKPYFNYYKLDEKIPLEIFPKNMRNNLKLLYQM